MSATWKKKIRSQVKQLRTRQEVLKGEPARRQPHFNRKASARSRSQSLGSIDQQALVSAVKDDSRSTTANPSVGELHLAPPSCGRARAKSFDHETDRTHLKARLNAVLGRSLNQPSKPKSCLCMNKLSCPTLEQIESPPTGMKSRSCTGPNEVERIARFLDSQNKRLSLRIAHMQEELATCQRVGHIC